MFLCSFVHAKDFSINSFKMIDKFGVAFVEYRLLFDYHLQKWFGESMMSKIGVTSPSCVTEEADNWFCLNAVSEELYI